MPRLPMPGSDAENWGNLLNEFLRVAHNEDGTPRGGSLFVNVKEFGALGNGVTDDGVAIQTAINSLPRGGVVYFPAGTYLIDQPNGLLFSVPNLVLQGSSRGASQLVAGGACRNALLQSQAAPVVHAGHIEIRDLTLNGSFTCLGLVSLFGAITAAFTVQRCEFRKFLNGVLLGGVHHVTIEDSTFNNFGKGIGTAISIEPGSADCAIVGCRFLWCSDGILVNAVSGELTDPVHTITIERNYFDLGWYTLPAKFSGNGAYTPTSISDSNGAFADKEVREGMYFRVLAIRQSGKVGEATTPTTLVDLAAAFQAAGTLAGELIRVTGAGYHGFAVITRVVSNIQLQVEEWLDDETRQPLPTPPTGADYTVYKVYLGRTTSAITATTVELFGRSVFTQEYKEQLASSYWFDVNGQEETPAGGLVYEFLPRPNYPIHLTPGVHNAKILHNTLNRGYSDQISVWGDQATIVGNHILWSQDMGITLNGEKGDGHSLIAQNILHKSGAGGLSVSAEHVTIANNIIKATTWVNAINKKTLGAIILTGAKYVTMIGNICNGQNLPHAYAGIIVWEAQSVSLSGNVVLEVCYFAVGVIGATVTNLRSAIDNDFWYTPKAFVHDPATVNSLYELQGGVNPENVVVAGAGSTYRDLSSGLFYIKQTGTGASGWTQLLTR